VAAQDALAEVLDAQAVVVVGDPACDVVIAWTLLSGESRQAFRDTLAIDDATWARGRGWALWKALITLAGTPADASSRHVIDQVLADHATQRTRGSHRPSAVGQRPTERPPRS
jgi:aminoglycoside phosphotransferase (APT) family kinase protein